MATMAPRVAGDMLAADSQSQLERQSSWDGRSSILGDVPLQPLNNSSVTADNGSTTGIGSAEAAPHYSIEALPPVDRGRKAWLFLLSATVLEILVWGQPFAVGVLHRYWTATLFPPGTPGASLLSLAATLQTGLLYCSCLVFIPLFARYPHRRVRFQVFGLVASALGLFTSAFVTKPWHLVVTLGMLYPMSGALYLPTTILLFEWWNAKRGLANGIMFSGTGAGGAIFPYVMQGLLNGVGYKWAMIVMAAVYFFTIAVCLLNIQPRVPTPPRGSVEARRARKFDLGFLRRSTFYAFCGSILLSSLGNFIPTVWIPSFASDLGLDDNAGTLLLAIMNVASLPGLLIVGYLSDKIPIRWVISLCCFGSTLSCIFLWGFGTSLPILVVFCAAFGALALSFSAAWTKLITIIARDDPAVTGLIFALFAFSRGIGTLTSGPVADALLAHNTLGGSAGGYGVANYGSLLLYTGITMLIGSIVGVSYRDKRST